MNRYRPGSCTTCSLSDRVGSSWPSTTEHCQKKFYARHLMFRFRFTRQIYRLSVVATNISMMWGCEYWGNFRYRQPLAAAPVCRLSNVQKYTLPNVFKCILYIYRLLTYHWCSSTIWLQMVLLSSIKDGWCYKVDGMLSGWGEIWVGFNAPIRC